MIYCVFPKWFVAPEGRKVGSLKRRVRSQLARGKMKNCMPIWYEIYFQIKMSKIDYIRTIFGSWDVEKCTPLWHEIHFEIKINKTHQYRPLLELAMSKKWREAHFQVKIHKPPQNRTIFGNYDVEKINTVVTRNIFLN